MRYNYGKLKGRIKEVYGTQKDFAEAINLSKVSLSKKLNNKTDFSQSEIFESIKVLKIPEEEISMFFFTYKV